MYEAQALIVMGSKAVYRNPRRLESERVSSVNEVMKSIYWTMSASFEPFSGTILRVVLGGCLEHLNSNSLSCWRKLSPEHSFMDIVEVLKLLRTTPRKRGNHLLKSAIGYIYVELACKNDQHLHSSHLHLVLLRHTEGDDSSV